jgi:sugar lactone lactonase YvrE
VNASLRLMITCVTLLMLAWAPMKTSAAEALRYRHALSLYVDDQGAGLSQPQGVACTDNSVLVVADTANSRLLRYVLTEDGSKPQVQVWKPAAMIYPQKIRLNLQGGVYVFDGKLRRIMHLSAEGKFLGFIDPVGLPSPARITIRSFDLDQRGNIYFLDILSKRVVVCNANGEYQKQFQFPETYGFFSDVAVDTRENIFLVDSINAQVFTAKSGAAAFSALSQSLKEYTRFPSSLAIDQQGRIYLSDLNGSKIVILTQTGSYVGKLSALGWKEGLLSHPSQICLNNRGDLFVADTSNNRIQIFAEVK